MGTSDLHGELDQIRRENEALGSTSRHGLRSSYRHVKKGKSPSASKGFYMGVSSRTKRSSSKSPATDDGSDDDRSEPSGLPSAFIPRIERKNIQESMTNEGAMAFTEEQLTSLIRRAVRSHSGDQYGYNFPFAKEVAEVNYPKGHKTINFTLFSGEDVRKNAAVHIARFITQCGDLSKFNVYKLKLFGSSLTGVAFGWYSRLKPASVSSWDEMERIFREQFGKVEAEVGISEMSSLS